MFDIIIVHQTLAFSTRVSDPTGAEGKTAASSMGVKTSSSLHASSCLYDGDAIGGDAVDFRVLARHQAVAIRVGSRQIQQVDPGKDDQESTKERKGVDRIRCVEAFEEDEGGAQRGCCEGYIVKWVDD